MSRCTTFAAALLAVGVLLTAVALPQGSGHWTAGTPMAGTFNQVEAYDAGNTGWNSHGRMPTARHGLGAAMVGGRIYVISGGPTPDSVSAANEIFLP
jgi:hypothetical protein